MSPGKNKEEGEKVIHFNPCQRVTVAVAGTTSALTKVATVDDSKYISPCRRRRRHRERRVFHSAHLDFRVLERLFVALVTHVAKEPPELKCRMCVS